MSFTFTVGKCLAVEARLDVVVIFVVIAQL